MSRDIEEHLLNLSKELNLEVTEEGVHHKDSYLITLISNCPFLYDRSRLDYKNAQKKEDTWAVIAKILNAKPKECKSRWNILKETYRRHNRNKNSIHEGIEHDYEWEYMKDMDFMKEHTRSNRSAEENEHETGVTEVNGPISLVKRHTEIKLNKINLNVSEDCDSDSFDYNLIELVKNVPILYRSGQNRERKNAIWPIVAKKLGVSVRDCAERWKLIRQRFSKERALLEKNPQHTRWELFDELKFLTQVVKRRKPPDWYERVKQSPHIDDSGSANTIDKLLELADKSEMVQKIEYLDPNYLDCASVEVESSNSIDMLPPLVPLTKTQKIGQSSENSAIENYLNTSPKSVNSVRVVKLQPKLQQSSEKYLKSPTAHICEQVTEISNAPASSASRDEDDFFGQTIGLELKKIKHKRKKMRLKADIFKLLFDAQSDSDS